MITISACLIVKNEEQVLSRCLDSLKNIVDEIIIVDTGSADKTIEIAKLYTDKIYNFQWIDDFSAARNYSFEKATMDYIYVADADEVIDEENRNKFLELKDMLVPEVEIVQMIYANQLLHNTTYNYDKEFRPKLYKRIRKFRWIDPLHEAVALQPVIYDSDIEILHMPMGSHAKRDFATYKKAISKQGRLSKKLNGMYARELFIAGDEEDFLEASDYFNVLLEEEPDIQVLKQYQCVIAKASLLRNNLFDFFKVCLKNVATNDASAELCYLLGEYYFELEDYKEACIWYYNAAFETSAELNIHYGGDYPLLRLADCYGKLGNEEEAEKYRKLSNEWMEKN